jgi:hypothetical protein
VSVIVQPFQPPDTRIETIRPVLVVSDGGLGGSEVRLHASLQRIHLRNQQALPIQHIVELEAGFRPKPGEPRLDIIVHIIVSEGGASCEAGASFRYWQVVEVNPLPIGIVVHVVLRPPLSWNVVDDHPLPSGMVVPV